MTLFEQHFEMTVADQALLVTITLGAGYVFNWLLAMKKARDSALQEISRHRVRAFVELWKILANLPAQRTPKLDDTMLKKDLNEKLTKWYYEQSGAMYLSWWGTRRLFRIFNLLRNSNSDYEKLRKAFSRLRTQLKRDVGVYSWVAAWRQLKPPRESQQTS